MLRLETDDEKLLEVVVQTNYLIHNAVIATLATIADTIIMMIPIIRIIAYLIAIVMTIK